MDKDTILDGKVNLYKRPSSRFWQCSAYLDGKNRRASTGQESLFEAKLFAEEWYLTLRGKMKDGTLKNAEKTFRQAALQFQIEYETITQGQRSPAWVRGHKDRLRLHLLPFLGDLGLSEVTSGKVQEYRLHRIETARGGKPPARNTLHNEIVTLRQVLKTAIRHGWLDRLPDLSMPYKTQGKISHRPWFSPKEYKQLYQATRENAQNPSRPQDKKHAEDLHDFVLFMANTGLRPDEASNLEHRDIDIVEDAATDEVILEIEVRGKRGMGYCKSMPGAVMPYRRLVQRHKPEPQDKVFPVNHIRMFNTILRNTGLKTTRDGKRRTAYSLRHTYICLRLMEGADIYQVAKNCRTSVEMIERFYAAHIKDTIDTAAVNVRRDPKKRNRSIAAEILDEDAEREPAE
ncbi:tyrosine-type recombinase/integrase [Glycocaulis abyssi]|uniref:Tyrosine-type recombinase/integrase n=1 Tax=Glycocaulis abyssi TaxID=1433403 RepID=A0ABV9N9I4_9PROT